MQTQLLPSILASPEGAAAERILRTCVHCGFCNATCPTYQLLGDELDGPRGRIYLIKQMLEGQAVSATTQLHLDRCLQCNSCETTCPSGVRYGRLLDIGLQQLERIRKRTLRERLWRDLLLVVLPHRRRFAALLVLARLARPMLPAALGARIPQRRKTYSSTSVPHAKRILRLQGCVHEHLAPQIEHAAIQVFDRVEITLDTAEGCCGALEYHLGAQARARRRMCANLDRWLPALDAGAAALTSTASGCTAFLKSYGEILADDSRYARQAERFSERVQDPSEILAAQDKSPLRSPHPQRVAFQSPCTLTHSLKLGDTVQRLLQELGHTLLPVAESHLCCGSAGSYSLTQPKLAGQLRERKLAALLSGQPEQIVSANVGCITHLQAGTAIPIRHWLELLAEKN